MCQSCNSLFESLFNSLSQLIESLWQDLLTADLRQGDAKGLVESLDAGLSEPVDRNVPAPMRDGTILYADVYRPADGERHATLLQRTPYDKSGPLVPVGFPLRAATRL